MFRASAMAAATVAQAHSNVNKWKRTLFIDLEIRVIFTSMLSPTPPWVTAPLSLPPPVSFCYPVLDQ